MRALIFHLGNDSYGLPAGEIVQVLPMLTLKLLPQAPAYVAGLMNYHGMPVPVIDLCRLVGGNACRERFDTRLIVVNYLLENGSSRRLGLLVERVTGMQELNQRTLIDSGVSNATAPYLGTVTADREQGILQMVEVKQLLPAAVRAQLFPTTEPTAYG